MQRALSNHRTKKKKEKKDHFVFIKYFGMQKWNAKPIFKICFYQEIEF